MKRWEEVFIGTDRELLQRSGMGQRQEYGKSPALLIVDVTRRYGGNPFHRQPWRAVLYDRWNL